MIWEVVCPQCQQVVRVQDDGSQNPQTEMCFVCPGCETEVSATIANTPELTPRKAEVSRAASRKQVRNFLVLGIAALVGIGAIAYVTALRKTGDTHKRVENLIREKIHNRFFTDLIASGVTTAKDLDAVMRIHSYGPMYVGVSKEGLTLTQARDLAKRTGSRILKIQDPNYGTPEELTTWVGLRYHWYLKSLARVQQFGADSGLNVNGEVKAVDETAVIPVLLQWRGPDAMPEVADTGTPAKVFRDSFDAKLNGKLWQISTNGPDVSCVDGLVRIHGTTTSDGWNNTTGLHIKNPLTSGSFKASARIRVLEFSGAGKQLVYFKIDGDEQQAGILVHLSLARFQLMRWTPRAYSPVYLAIEDGLEEFHEISLSYDAERKRMAGSIDGKPAGEIEVDLGSAFRLSIVGVATKAGSRMEIEIDDVEIFYQNIE